jgi:hypothetical protein
MTRPTSIGAAVPYLHLLEDVRLEKRDWPEAGSVSVTTVWRGVDRTETSLVVLRPSMRALADRLLDVVRRGDAFETVEVKTDVNGRTYMSLHNRFAVMELEEDLDTLDRIGPQAGALQPA